MARQQEVFVNDEQWKRIELLITKRERSARGGRPAADNRACLEGILLFFVVVLDGEICQSGIPLQAPAGVGWQNGNGMMSWLRFGMVFLKL